MGLYANVFTNSNVTHLEEDSEHSTDGGSSSRCKPAHQDLTHTLYNTVQSYDSSFSASNLDTSSCKLEESRIKPPSFWWGDNELHLLSHSRQSQGVIQKSECVNVQSSSECSRNLFNIFVFTFTADEQATCPEFVAPSPRLDWRTAFLFARCVNSTSLLHVSHKGLKVPAYPMVFPNLAPRFLLHLKRHFNPSLWGLFSRKPTLFWLADCLILLRPGEHLLILGQDLLTNVQKHVHIWCLGKKLGHILWKMKKRTQFQFQVNKATKFYSRQQLFNLQIHLYKCVQVSVKLQNWQKAEWCLDGAAEPKNPTNMMLMSKMQKWPNLNQTDFKLLNLPVNLMMNSCSAEHWNPSVDSLTSSAQQFGQKKKILWRQRLPPTCGEVEPWKQSWSLLTGWHHGSSCRVHVLVWHMEDSGRLSLV